MTKNGYKFVLILENIRSIHNVGSIFRTADAAKVSCIYLVGTTPTPEDRFGRARRDLAKVALGAEKNLAWEHHKTISSLIRKLKKEGFQIIALEQDHNSADYRKIKIGEKTVLILGNEVNGVSQKTLAEADVICEIPMYGKKESLNVSVSAGIAIFQLLGI